MPIAEKKARKPAIHAADCQSRVHSDGTSENSWLLLSVMRSPSVSTRTRFTQIVTGLFCAIGCSHEGNVSGGTKAELTKTNGNTIVNSAAWTASIVFSVSPAKADTQVNTYPTPTMTPNASSASHTLVWIR